MPVSVVSIPYSCYGVLKSRGGDLPSRGTALVLLWEEKLPNCSTSPYISGKHRELSLKCFVMFLRPYVRMQMFPSTTILRPES